MTKMAEWVYETLAGLTEGEESCPGVENAFAEGKRCAVLYTEVLEAYSRICSRLAVGEEDADVEIIINNFLEMESIMCREMYVYGFSHAHRNIGRISSFTKE